MAPSWSARTALLAVGVLLAGCASPQEQGPASESGSTGIPATCDLEGLPMCPQVANESGGLRLVGAVDRTVLPPGGNVTFHFAVRNTTGNSTSYVHCMHSDDFRLRDANGTYYQVPRPFEGSVCHTLELPAGETMAWSIPWSGQASSDGYPRVPPGRYTATDTFRGEVQVVLHVQVT